MGDVLVNLFGGPGLRRLGLGQADREGAGGDRSEEFVHGISVYCRKTAAHPASERSENGTLWQIVNMLHQDSITQFRSQFRGTVIEPEDSRYTDARKVFNGMIDRKPRLIAQCVDVADVMTAVRFARANSLKVSIRGGGHNAAGLGVCDDGLVIDLAPIRYVRVDPSSRTVLVGAGCKWSDVDHATHAFGLAVPSGIISSTGVAGLTLGGGMGHL